MNKSSVTGLPKGRALHEWCWEKLVRCSPTKRIRITVEEEPFDEEHETPKQAYSDITVAELWTRVRNGGWSEQEKTAWDKWIETQPSLPKACWKHVAGTEIATVAHRAVLEALDYWIALHGHETVEVTE